MVIGELKDMFFSFLYRFFAFICQLIDFIKSIFYMLVGITPVRVDGEETNMLTYMMGYPTVKKAFLLIFLIGFILLVVFTVVALIKVKYQEKQSWKSVLEKTSKSFLVMLIIPFCLMAGILLTNTVMASVNMAMTPGTVANPTIGGEFLATIGNDCYIGSEPKDEAIAKFVSGEHDYKDLDLIKRYFDIERMNYLIGILGGLVMLIMFVLSSITFVQRVFDIVLLYLISPITASTIPLDEGNRFKVWKDMTIGKVLSAYGVILSMNLFFLIMPIVYEITFFDNAFENGVVHILFLIGGSFAVTKATDIIARLSGSQQGGRELAEMIYNVRSAFAIQKALHNSASRGIGKLIGGSTYNRVRAKGGTRMEAFKASRDKRVNQRAISPKDRAKKQSKLQKALKTPLRMASMPMGMIHDISQGGFVAFGKNFMPRLNNAIKGNTAFSHAEVMRKGKPKNPNTESNNKGKLPTGPRRGHPKARNGVYRRDDSDKEIRVRRPRRRKK